MQSLHCLVSAIWASHFTLISWHLPLFTIVIPSKADKGKFEILFTDHENTGRDLSILSEQLFDPRFIPIQGKVLHVNIVECFVEVFGLELQCHAFIQVHGVLNSILSRIRVGKANKPISDVIMVLVQRYLGTSDISILQVGLVELSASHFLRNVPDEYISVQQFLFSRS